jgi:O-antigen ligase
MTAYPRWLVAVLVWGALAFGGVYPWAYWPLATVCAGLGVWGLAASGGRFDRLRGLASALGAVAVAIGVQLVPLPYGVFTRVDPGADHFLSEYSVAYSVQPPPWHALSVSPASTGVALALFVAFAALFVGLAAVLRQVRLDRLIAQIAIFGVVLALFGVIQRAFVVDNQPLVYGFWRPAEGGGVFGPFINRNHFAGWMVMALPLAFGYFCAMAHVSWHEQGERVGRWLRWMTTPEASRVGLIGFCVLAMATSLVLTGSRSGIASFAAAMLVLAYFGIRQASRRFARTLALVAVVALVSGAVAWAGVDVTWTRFSLAATDMPGRLGAWRDTVRIIRDFAVWGTGLGTYGLVMLLYQTGDRSQIFMQAHNDYLQLVAEGGVLVAIPAAIALLTAARAIWRRLAATTDTLLAHWIRVGAVAGLVGIAAQSCVEFSLQMPGNATLFVVLAAIAIHEPRPDRRAAGAATPAQTPRVAR